MTNQISNDTESLKETINELSIKLKIAEIELEKLPQYKHRSLYIDKLAEALSKAQSEFTIAQKKNNNPFFKSKYADYTECVLSSRPMLNKYGISVKQPIIRSESGEDILHTILTHSSGQWQESTVKLNPSKSDVQSFSSYNTYIKRLAYNNLVGVLTGEEDDDGEAAVAYERQQPKPVESLKVTPEQLEQLEYELDGYPAIALRVKKGMNIKELSEMPRESFIKNINRIKELVQEEKNNR